MRHLARCKAKGKAMTSSIDPKAKSNSSPRAWTYAEAVKAVPYLRSVVGSLRESWLQLRRAQREMQLIEGRGDRADRETLASRQDAQREANSAQSRVNEALAELAALHVDRLDPAQGLAMIPAGAGEKASWLVFDFFAPQGKQIRRSAEASRERQQPVAENHHRLVDKVFSQFDTSMFRSVRLQSGQPAPMEDSHGRP